MPVKRYGIFLAYPPKLDLRAQGLGRYLAAFLKGAAERDDVEIIVACPSWLRLPLEQLCDAERVSAERFEILSPPGLPLSLRAYDGLLQWHRRDRNRRWLARLTAPAFRAIERSWLRVERQFVSTRSILVFAGLLLLVTPLAMLVGLSWLIFIAASKLARAANEGLSRIGLINLQRARLQRLMTAPSQELLAIRLHGSLEKDETDRLIDMINRRDDIVAWYCPTAFWPAFNRIKAPRLMCVPDAAFNDFPVGFEQSGRAGLFARLSSLDRAIRGASQLVTYSQHVKWHTLSESYGRSPEAVHVIPHAASVCDEFIRIRGTTDDFRATEAFCRVILHQAFAKATNPDYAAGFQNDDVRFLVYPSQFRPHKNLLTLLQAYEHLLRKRFLGIKLVLTGNPDEAPDVRDFIEKHDLGHDVLCLRNLTMQELAACYRLARLAVNPSLSEGGCPFTFTEAVSVGTPAVMARIAVTEEAITDQALRDMMLFDPHDWRDMARRIEWGLENRDQLYRRQRVVFEQQAHRTWKDVVSDHIAVLDRIAAQDDGSMAVAS